MRAYIHKLQSKPEETRKQILVGAMIVSMAFVGSVWVYGFSVRSQTKQAEASESQAKSSVAPFKMFAQSVSSVYKNITASVGNISFSKQQEEETPKQIDLIPVEHPTN